MGLHPLARRFGPVADRYDRGRPDYPPAAVAWLAAELDLRPGARVVDLGAGTGKLTTRLEELELDVVAVEPSAGMRAVFRHRRGPASLIAGLAEALPLGESSARAVIVGSAFHWFDVGRTAGEIARVVGPGGGLAIAYPVREERERWTREIAAILDRLDPGAPRARTGKWRTELEADGRFDPLRRATFPHAQTLTPDGVVDRVLSVSFVANRPTPELQEIAAEVRAILRSDPATAGRETVRFPYRTEVYTSRTRPA